MIQPGARANWGNNTFSDMPVARHKNIERVYSHLW
jgi:hypothetical protein